MKKPNVYKLTISACFAAIIFIVTAFIPIKIPVFTQGYFNLGDCFIIIAAILLNGMWGGLAGAVGASVADLVLGYAMYAPATFFIKLTMGITAYYIYKGLIKLKLKSEIIATIISSVFAEIVMVVGYFLFEIVIYGIPTAVADIIGNVLQGTCTIIAVSIIFIFIKKSGFFSKLLNDKIK